MTTGQRNLAPERLQPGNAAGVSIPYAVEDRLPDGAHEHVSPEAAGRPG